MKNPDTVHTTITGGEISRIAGRERRQDDRQWAALHDLAKEAGHQGHDWHGVGVPPLGEHLVPHLFTCRTCDEVMFVTDLCSRRLCRECFPEGWWEHMLSWARRPRKESS